MAKIALIKTENNNFVLAHDSDYEEAKKIKPNQVYTFEYKKPRNYQFHKKFFALIKLLFDNQELYLNTDDLRHDLLIAAGQYTLRYNFKGEEVIEPLSVSFASMDEDQFTILYNSVLDAIVKNFNFDREDIINNVQQYF